MPHTTLHCYRVWFDDESVLLVDAVSVDAARAAARLLSRQSTYAWDSPVPKITTIEDLTTITGP